MPLDFAHGSFAWAAADGVGTTYVVSGLAFQPKAIRFEIYGLNSAVDAGTDNTEPDCRAIGFATSATNRACVGGKNVENSASMATAMIYSASAVIRTVGSGGLASGALDLDSIQSGGFTCIVDVVLGTESSDPTAARVFWYAWGGSDIANAEVFTVTEPAATGNQDYVLSGAFQPDVLMLATGKTTTSVLNIDMGLSVGCATGSAQQWVVCTNQDDGSASADTDRYFHGAECLALIAEAGGNPAARATFVQFNTNGFRLNWIARAVTARSTVCLAIKGGQWRAGTYTIDGTTVNATATVSGLPFQPIGALTAFHWGPQNAAGVSSTVGVMSTGCWSSLSSRRSMGINDENATANSDINLRVEYDQILVAPNSTGGILAAYDIDAINADGFRVKNDVAGGSDSAEIHGYLAFASSPATEAAWIPRRGSFGQDMRVRR